LALGALQPADLELGADGMPRLRAAPGLRRIAAGDANDDDLRTLATLLEALTGTERTTKRLDEDQATQLIAEPGLPDILRELRTGAITDAAALAERLDSLIAERTQPAPLWVRIGAASHAGMVRDVDEDSLLALDLRMVQNSRGRSWGLFIVADGMGGHDAGEVASGLAIRGAAEVILSAYLAPTIESDAQYEEARLKEIVRKAILQANEYVIREAQARSNDMGTTITMALVAGDRAVIGNIGDSRTYIYRDGALRRITNDHSLVMRLVDIGQITEEEIYTHPQRNAVLRSLGDKPELEVDLFSERLRSGDALLLCCDGQWEMTRNPQMAEIIARHDDPQAACDALIAAANAAGGEDNITSVLVRFEKYGE
jgi:serine/threonine protein phosphatase PrpC